jgi:hypothetical protein
VTLPQLAELDRFWRENPPLHVMVAAYLGVSGKAAGATTNEQDMGEFLAVAPLIGVTVKKEKAA